MRLRLPTAQEFLDAFTLFAVYALAAVLHDKLGHGLSFGGLAVSGIGTLVVYRMGWRGLLFVILPVEIVTVSHADNVVKDLPEIFEHVALFVAMLVGFDRGWHHYHVVRVSFWRSLFQRAVIASLLPAIFAALVFIGGNYAVHLAFGVPLEIEEGLESIPTYAAGVFVVGFALTSLREQLPNLLPALRERTNWILLVLVAGSIVLGNLDDETNELVEIYEVALGFSIAVLAAAIAGSPVGALLILFKFSARVTDEMRGAARGLEGDDQMLVQIAITVFAAALVMYFEYRAYLMRATNQRLRLYRDIVESANEAFLVTHPNGSEKTGEPGEPGGSGESIMLTNSAAVTLTGLSKEELHRTSPDNIWRKITHCSEETNLVYFADDTEFTAKQFKAVRKDGKELWLSRTVRKLSEENWNPKPTVHQLRDISTSVMLRTELQALLFRYELVWHAVRDVLIVTDGDGRVLDWNNSAVGLLGYSAEEAIGNATLWRKLSLLDEQGQAVEPSRFKALDEAAALGELPLHRGVRRDGTYFWASVNVRPIPTLQPQEQAWFICITPQTQQVADAARLTLLAFSDPLTGLPNRRALEERLTAQLRDDADPVRAAKICVCFIDLDGFNTVNSLHGHAEGDALLIRVAAALRVEMREGETLSRLAGDEFVAVLHDVASQAHALERTNAMLERTRSVVTELTQTPLTASIGAACAFAEASPPSARALVKRANAAMRRAKLAGRNVAVVFDGAMTDSTELADEVSRRVMSSAFAESIVVMFQPVVEIGHGGVSHVEALSRLRLDADRLIPAGQFIPLAEELRRTIILTVAVLAQVERFARRAHECKRAVPSVAVNVVADDLLDSQLCASILRTQAALVPLGGELWLEITERTIMSTDARRSVDNLIAHGIRVSLDDFGVGYSNLSAIASGGWSAIKLDGSLTRDAATSKQTQRLLQATVDTFAGTSVVVIAEGIENEAQLNALHAVGVRFFQGFHLCRPTDAEALFEMLPQSVSSSDQSIYEMSPGDESL